MKNIILPISIINIHEDMSHQRIDNFLITKYKNIPKSMIYRIIRTGQVRVNQKRIKPHYKLNTGDKVRIPPIRTSHQKNHCIPFNNIDYLSNKIIYEDDFLIIINKPSGFAVHGGSGVNLGVIEYFRKITPFNTFLELVHRLDRETSGILILAKKRIALCTLHQQLREKKIKKEYTALVHGLWPSHIKKISEPILKIESCNRSKKVSINKHGKPSETYFQIIKKYSSSTLLSIIPKTGRTHQIRIHAYHAGHPIVFDTRYGKKDLDSKMLNQTKTNRLLLHASKICFQHPKNGNKLYITAPLETQFQNYLNTLT